MKERPILFSTPMVKAILGGKKTQTRRVVSEKHGITNVNSGLFSPMLDRCPYGQKGDRLWVRETFCPHDDGIDSGGCSHVFYRATEELPFSNLKWKPSIFMPREYCRILLEITEISAERLHDITREDATQEGFDLTTPRIGEYDHYPEIWFSHLWKKINGAESWDSNPWVWVVKFKVVKP